MKREQANKIVTSKEIGAKIRMRRREMGLSQERLAELLDVTYQQVQRYENGSSRLYVERIQQISTVVGVSLDFFFGASSDTTRSDSDAKYLAGDETLLLAHYRRISDQEDRQLVVAVARLAARKGGAAESLQPV